MYVSEGALQAATLSTSVSLGGLVSISGTRGTGVICRFFRDCVVIICGGQYWFRRIAGYGSLAVLPPTSVGSVNGTVVGGRLVYIAVAPAAAGPEMGWILDDFGSAPAGQ